MKVSDKGSIRILFYDYLGMKPRLVPKILNFLQKLIHVNVADSLLERVNSDPTFITSRKSEARRFTLRTSYIRIFVPSSKCICLHYVIP